MSGSHDDGTVCAGLVSELVAAYVANNSLPMSELPDLIRTVHQALFSLDRPAAAPEPPKPAVPVRKSVTDDYIVSLEDGRKLKSMKRYLAGLGMTPAEYRAKWGLPADYPTVAPAYAKQRSELAKTLGLGRKGAGPRQSRSPGDVDPVPEPRRAGRAAA